MLKSNWLKWSQIVPAYS